MKNKKISLIHSRKMESFHYPPDCPFNVQRAHKLKHMLERFQILHGENRAEVEPRPAERRELELFHTPDYLDELRRAADNRLSVQALQRGLGTPDTPIFPDIYEHGVWTAGATLTAAETLLAGEADIAFNPSGGLHHAMAGHAAGFCYINDVVIGCMHLAQAGKKVLFLDIDVHHGDGVQAAFYDRSDVMTISVHENGRMLYPGTGFVEDVGEGPGEGYAVNIPLPPGTYDEAYMYAFHEAVLPLMKSFSPDVLVCELGMDALEGDPLAHLSLTNNTHVAVITECMKQDIPILATGGGGYHVRNCVRGWALAWATFCGEEYLVDAGMMGGAMRHTDSISDGLYDVLVPVPDHVRETVAPEVHSVVTQVKNRVFPYHGLARSREAKT